MTASSSAPPRAEGLAQCIAWLDELLAAAVDRQRARAAADGEFRGIYISEAEVDGLLNLRPLSSGLNGRALNLSDRWPDSPLDSLEERAGLTAFDRAVLILALAPQLDRRYSRLYAYLQDDLTKPYPTAGLALDLFCQAFSAKADLRQRFAPEAPLIALGLVDLDGDDSQPLIFQPLVVDERLVDFALGRGADDPALSQAGARLLPGPDRDLVLNADDDRRFGRLLADWPTQSGSSVLCLVAEAGSGRRLGGAHLAAACGRPLLVVPFDPTSLADPQRPLREALLSDAVLCLSDADKAIDPEEPLGTRWLRSFEIAARSCEVPIILTLAAADRVPGRLWGRTVTLFQIAPPGTPERTRIWQNEAQAAGLSLSVDQASLLAVTYRLNGANIRRAIGHAQVSDERQGKTDERLIEAARRLSTFTLGRLGQEVTPRFSWHDIVIPAEVEESLREVVLRVRHQPRVFGQWGFNRRHASSRSLSVLFSGPSGTGKTMAAEIIANELALPLYRVDLSAVVSKYIGETEKNLAQIFADASTSGAILFFDEADALFGRRSEVRDSHDRYANLEVSYLLQRMEDYDGIVILASNLRKNMDEAFVRRLHLAVDFPFPDASSRSEIWRRTLPRETPLADDVDLDALAQRFRLSGGNIRNACVTAAFLAAADDSSVTMGHFLAAVRREHQKMGKLLIDDEGNPEAAK